MMMGTILHAQCLLVTGGNQTTGSAADPAAVEAAAVPGAAVAGWQLWCSHGSSDAGPQGWPAHLSPLQT